MQTVELEEDNVLTVIRDVRYGLAGDYRNDQRFKRELLSYQKFLTRNGHDTISLQAVGGWFAPSCNIPRRAEALAFLRSYLLWWAGREPPKTVEAADKIDFLITFLGHKVEALEGASRLHRPKLLHFRGHVDAEKWKAIEGTYQIIRPFVSKPSHFALEAMSIEPKREGVSATALMYSHNQPHKEFVYEGDFFLADRYCSGVIHRPDDENIDSRVTRCIMLHVEFKRHTKGYTPRKCISGLMLRGVRAHVTGDMAVALPFVALQAPPKSSNMHVPNFSEIGKKLLRLNHASHVLVGQVDNSKQGIFEFCNSLFYNIKSDIYEGLTMRTVRPEELESAITDDPIDDDAYFKQWIQAVEFYIRTRRLGVPKV